MSDSIVTKADLEVEANLRDWRKRVFENWGMHCDLGSTMHARSSVHSWALGRVKVATAEFGSQAWTSAGPASPAAVWRKDAMTLKLVQSGSIELEHDGRCERFGIGSVVLVDCAANYRESFEEDTQIVLMQFPKQALFERGFRRAAGGGFDAADATAPDVRALRDFVLHAARQGEAPSMRVRGRLGEQLLDTLDVVADTAAGSRRARSGEATLYRAKRVIEQHFGDTALNPEQVATHAHASVDHLHRLFRAEGITLMGYVWRVRLAKAMHLLSQDEGRHHMQIQQVAYQCGFATPAHFSRVFRKQYGVTPREAMDAAH
ncbi:helix-turn-helix transcriptional regulator [Paraburkholderia solisilvae]|uniref:HTH-type transcriptional activator RhaS n=1 Tax=Paraburkholderia solisilvae TaxID=624376 RepID=A0A6J5E7P6_9BURK|nr:AraC family transcriptional regulator [Paraburkholderia solisilvae]CAB3761331.1 HTH-type transcriptional activator RhaS [Paraburkholderia solisilvae]